MFAHREYMQFYRVESLDHIASHFKSCVYAYRKQFHVFISKKLNSFIMKLLSLVSNFEIVLHLPGRKINFLKDFKVTISFTENLQA